MRRIVLRVRAAQLDDAYDVLLPLLRGGLHLIGRGEDAELVALGEDGELPPLAEVERAASGLLLTPAREEDAGPDLAAALAPLRGRWEIGGRVVLRRAEHAPAPAGWVDVVLGEHGGFGTGAHPTTRHCLELLLGLDPGGAFADLGCGAGALTVAAARLGFSPVTGVELEPGVAEEARRTVALNQVDAQIVTGDLLELAPPAARVAVVNVSSAAVHRRMAEHAARGWDGLEALVAAGLNDPELSEAAVRAYAAAGLTVAGSIAAEGWPATLLTRG